MCINVRRSTGGAMKWQSRSIISGAWAIALCSRKVNGVRGKKLLIMSRPISLPPASKGWDEKSSGRRSQRIPTKPGSCSYVLSPRGFKDLANHANISQATHASSPTNLLLINPSGRFLFSEHVFLFTFLRKGWYLFWGSHWVKGETDKWIQWLLRSFYLSHFKWAFGTSRGRKYGHQLWCLI